MYYVPRNSVLAPRLLWRSASDLASFFPWKHGAVVFYEYGRNALYHGLRLLKIPDDSTILLPAYLCRSITDTVAKLPLRMCFYRLTDSLTIDLEDLQNKLEGKRGILLIIHYYGFPQPIPQIREFCNRYNLYLVEDCAHALWGEEGGQVLGSSGDISIFSMRKSLPLPEGGALVVNNRELGTPPLPDVPAMCGLLKRSFLRLEDYLAVKLHFSLRLKLLTSPSMQHRIREANESAGDDFDFNRGISFLTSYILLRLKKEEVVLVRRRNFLVLLDRIDWTEEVKPLFAKLPDGVSPFGFPVLVENRDLFYRKLLGCGINAMRVWHDLPEIVPQDESSWPYYLARHILLLPVHESLSEKMVERMVEVVNRLLGEK